MKYAKAIIVAVALLSPVVSVAKEKPIDELRSIIESACKKKGLRVSCASSPRFGVYTLIPSVIGEPADGSDSAWKIHECILPDITKWAKENGGWGSGAHNFPSVAPLVVADGEAREAPEEKGYSIDGFRLRARDFVGIVYQKASSEKGPGTLVIYFIDGEEFSRFGIQDPNAEQGAAGQPATRPESKSEGGDKPQPEAEGRSR